MIILLFIAPTVFFAYLCITLNERIMEVIQSFTIDHTRLKPGIYVSREDKGFTTFDLRITEPNKEPAVAPAAMHSLETWSMWGQWAASQACISS